MKQKKLLVNIFLLCLFMSGVKLTYSSTEEEEEAEEQGSGNGSEDEQGDIYVVDAEMNCWNDCGHKGGRCPEVCGTNGYCCRRGFEECPEDFLAVAPANHHTCVRYKAPPCGEQYLTSSNSNRFHGIVGGKNAREGAWPWQVGIYWDYWKKGKTIWCGGTLIRSNVVLTAAHCIHQPDVPSKYHVRVGDLDLTADGPQEKSIDVKKITNHAQYNKTVRHLNDISVIILKEHAIVMKLVNVACLPEKKKIFDKSCIVTGWGTLKEKGSTPDILQEVEVPIVSNDICSKSVPGVVHGMICAGLKEGGKDSCQGDSGGPLVCRKEDGNFEVRGVVSWGVGCARPEKYGVYADVHYYMDWIKENENES